MQSILRSCQLLEKALTGNDVIANGAKSAKDAKKPKKSKLVADPHPTTEVKIFFSYLILSILFCMLMDS